MWKIVKGFTNYIVSSDGVVFNLKKLRVEKQCTNTYGYYQFNMYNNYGQRKTVRIHRILALTFIDNQYNKPCVDHIDNIRINNNLDNLRWSTVKENDRNRSLSKSSTTNVKGVSYHKATQKYRAYIIINGKYIHLGYFSTLEEARIVRVKRSKEEFGEFVNKCELTC